MSDRIEKQILLRAPIERVWRAISDPAEFGSWFGVTLENPAFTAGATATGKIRSKGYEHLTMEARIERIEPPRLLSFRWHPHAVDATKDYSAEPTTLVQFELAEVDGGTLLTVVESGFDAIPASRRDEARRGNEGGWASQMQNIERHVAGTP